MTLTSKKILDTIQIFVVLTDPVYSALEKRTVFEG